MAEKSSSKPENRINKHTEVSASELAAVLDVTSNHIYTLTNNGILQRTGRGRYLLSDSVCRYIENRLGKPVAEDDQRLDRAKREAEVRIKKAKAQVAELEAAELEGKLHRSEDVSAMTEELIYTIRGALLALPGRLAIDVIQAESAAAAADVIRGEVNHLMRELTQYRYDPQRYAERVRERMKWEGEGDSGDE